MDKNQLSYLIKETLTGIDKYSIDALNLLLGTAAQESRFGHYIRQLGSGPALGIFQMEPNTFIDICNNYLFYKDELRKSILEECRVYLLVPEMLEYNLKVSICFARIHYLRFPEPIPNTVEEMAKLWKLRYNSPKGAGTVQEFIDNYRKYVL